MKKPPAFWDASALVPLFVNEPATSVSSRHLRALAPVVWWGTLIEIHGAVSRLFREKEINDADRRGAVLRIARTRTMWREISPDETLRQLAIEILAGYPLKAGRAMQLAAALVWCRERPARRNFVCADERLSDTARSVGFTVIQIPVLPPTA